MIVRIAHLTICHLLCSRSKRHKVEESHREDAIKDGEKSMVIDLCGYRHSQCMS
jgi:hypothetical protein